MNYCKIILVCVLFIAYFLSESIQKALLREKADKLDSALIGWRQVLEANKRELKIKYDNVERELLRRDKQYKELLERVNKNDE